MRPRPRQSTLFPYTTLFRSLGGLDSLLSIVQMPAGVPVATFAIGAAGAANAALCAAAILANRRSEEHTSELQSRRELVCRLLLEKKKGQLARSGMPPTRQKN